MIATPADLLAGMYSTQTATDSHGRSVSIRGTIEQHFANALTEVVRANDARVVLEVGMAFGASSLAILAGLPHDGQLVSIDPFQSEHYDGVGVAMIAKSTRASSHRLVERPNYLALPHLLEEGLAPDLVYIDGNHNFDYVALDAFYADKLLRVGGVIGFNDCGFRSVHKFLRYFRKHRRYDEIDSGLSPNYRGKNPLITMVRTAEGRSNQDRYFRKREEWEPSHNTFWRF